LSLAAQKTQTESLSLSEQYIAREKKYGAFNYEPLAVVIAKGEGMNVYDVEGKKYYDFLSAYSSLNQVIIT